MCIIASKKHSAPMNGQTYKKKTNHTRKNVKSYIKPWGDPCVRPFCHSYCSRYCCRGGVRPPEYGTNYRLHGFTQIKILVIWEICGLNSSDKARLVPTILAFSGGRTPPLRKIHPYKVYIPFPWGGLGRGLLIGVAPWFLRSPCLKNSLLFGEKYKLNLYL